MKKIFSFSKKIFAMILVLVIAVCSVETLVYAFESTEQSTIYFEETHKNKLYYNDKAESESNAQELSGSYVNEVRYESNAEAEAKRDAAVKIRDNMIARKGKFTIDIRSERQDYTALVSEMFKLAISKELANSATAGDYLAWQYGGYSYTGTASYDNGAYDYSFTFKVTYYTTSAQEQKVTATVNKALDDMNIDSLDTYGKVKKIYDYVCKVCNYDYSNTKGYTKFTAYGALVENKAVCQGYSTLLYRMLEEAGIDNKIVTSTDHSWNIVEINGKYYNVDATWDDNYYDKGYNYLYFLKCAAHFNNHNREPEYKTAAFNNEHVMTAECYLNKKTTGTRCSNIEAAKAAKPKTVKLNSVNAVANGFTVKWTKITGVTGYQIQYATKSNFSGATTVTVASASATSKKITGRGYGKKYYVRIRGYKKSDGVTAYGNWSAAKNVTTPAKPNTVKLNSVNAASKAFTAKWNKIAGVTGYQVQYATNSSFKKATTTTAAAGAVSKKITKKAAKKKYYVRVRAYKKVNGTYVYGNWSTVKTVVTKK